MKHIKLFESFVNEELSPELQKRTYDAMMKIAKDPNAIDYLVRRQQADNVQKTLSPEVEKLRKELEEHGKRILKKRVYVNLDDDGLESGIVNLFVDDVVGKIKRMGGGEGLFGLTISKNKYESIYAGQNQNVTFLRDRHFIKTLKRLIVQIQKDEIPGEEVVPSEPESVTPEGSLDHNM